MMHYASIGNVDQICSVTSGFAHFILFTTQNDLVVNARHRKENNHMDLVAAFIVIKIVY
jgi:hypothetical protein